MVTGDNVITARSVAIKCGIITPNDESVVYDGEEFNSFIRDPDTKVLSSKWKFVFRLIFVTLVKWKLYFINSCYNKMNVQRNPYRHCSTS